MRVGVYGQAWDAVCRVGRWSEDGDAGASSRREREPDPAPRAKIQITAADPLVAVLVFDPERAIIRGEEGCGRRVVQQPRALLHGEDGKVGEGNLSEAFKLSWRYASGELARA